MIGRAAGAPGLVAAAVLAALAGPAAAQTPPPEFFTGLYARIGRAAGAEPALLDDLVRIAPGPGGGLELRVCQPEGAPGAAPLVLHFTRFGDVTNLLQGGSGADQLFCQFFTDLNNDPILVCSSAGARFTLTADPARAAEAGPGACG